MKLNLLLTYVGPNRRSDKTVIEMDLEYQAGDIQIVRDHWAQAVQRLRSELGELGIDDFLPRLPSPETASAAVESFGTVCADIAIALQNCCKHPVSERSFRTFDEQDRLLVIFEHEEFSSGEQAGILALTLMANAFPGLEIDLGEFGHDKSARQLFAQLHATAAELIPPPDTIAILQAAQQRDVPVIRLERGLYEPVRGDFRIRMNSMLMLGHAGKRQLIDGTFALEKSAPVHGLIFDRQKVMNAAASLGMPVPASRQKHQPVISPRRAERAASEIGYPVAVRTGNRRKHGSSQLNVQDEEQLATAIREAARFDDQLIVEKHIPGESWNLLVSNHESVAVFSADGARRYEGDVHSSTWEMITNASRLLNVGLLSVNVVTPDLTTILASVGGAVVDLDLAPRLNEVLANDQGLIEQAADGFVSWLMPAGADSRIPLIAVTGTNGKTTTSRMVAHIQRQTGRVTGLQCTDGRYINDETVLVGDASALKGHDRLLQEQSIEVAVFETHHAGIATAGFSFDWCDVAVCTNVTYEHIGHLGTATLSEMVELKRSLVERAKFAAILNADDEHCLSMIPFITAKRTCLVTMQKSAADLAKLSERDRYFCVTENVNGEDRIVIHDNESSLDVMAVNDIPATFNGAAKFNVINAMQAIAACHAEGVDPAIIRQAMNNFVMSKETTPWRLNFYEDLPFRVLVDFAHNPDGLRRVAEFTDGLEVEGRKIIVFSGFRDETQIRMMSEAVASHYDHYVVKSYGIPEYAKYDKKKIRLGDDEVNERVTGHLADAGVKPEQITVISDEMEAVSHTFEMANESDLLVLLLGYTGLEVVEDYMEAFKTGKSSPAQEGEST